MIVKLILSSLRAHFRCLPPKQVIYRDNKHFTRENFCWDLDSWDFPLELNKMKRYLSSLFTKNVRSNKKFWDAVKPFFSNKIGNLVENEELVKLFKTFFWKYTWKHHWCSSNFTWRPSIPQNDRVNVKNVVYESPKEFTNKRDWQIKRNISFPKS